jgi:hypothetical protein
MSWAELPSQRLLRCEDKTNFFIHARLPVKLSNAVALALREKRDFDEGNKIRLFSRRGVQLARDLCDQTLWIPVAEKPLLHFVCAFSTVLLRSDSQCTEIL